MNDLHEWFQKNDLCPENILYLYRSDRKTVVHRMDGEEAALYAPLHSVLSVLPENLFLRYSFHCLILPPGIHHILFRSCHQSLLYS